MYQLNLVRVRDASGAVTYQALTKLEVYSLLQVRLRDFDLELLGEVEVPLLDAARDLVTKWASKQGHDRCWYYPELFEELARLLSVDVMAPPGLPPRPEFENGCRRFQDEQYERESL